MLGCSGRGPLRCTEVPSKVSYPKFVAPPSSEVCQETSHIYGHLADAPHRFMATWQRHPTVAQDRLYTIALYTNAG